MPTDNTPDNWACFRRILEQLLENLELQAELVKSLLEEGDHADHLDFIGQLTLVDEPEAEDAPVKKVHRQTRSERFPNAIKPWTDQEDADIRNGVRFGLSDAQIGEFIGRTHRAVEDRRLRLGIKRGV